MLTRHTRRIDKGIMQASVHTRGGGGSGPHLLARKRVDDGGEGVLGSLVQLHKSTAFWHIQELLAISKRRERGSQRGEAWQNEPSWEIRAGRELSCGGVWWCVACGASRVTHQPKHEALLDNVHKRLRLQCVTRQSVASEILEQ